MPDYRRAFAPGGTFFLTLVTEGRQPLFRDAPTRRMLHDAIRECAQDRPFELVAIVLLPDHLHLLLTLPPADSDFSTRIAFLKARFTRSYLSTGGTEMPRSDSRRKHRNRGVWQRRFWEHLIRDPDDLNHHLDYIHYNPVKHGLVACPHAWAHSTFHRWARTNAYDLEWLCSCDGRRPVPPDFSELAGVELD